MEDIISHAGGGGGSISEQLADAQPIRHIVGRNISKADVVFYKLDGHRVALKTYAPRNILIRNTVGRWLVSREAAAYEAAHGVDGLPPFLGRIGSCALATEWIDAAPLRSHSDSRVDDRVFDQLASVVDQLHDRGVALGDLHHRDVLLADDQTVYVVDLATALILGRQPGVLRKFLFRRLSETDRVNLARMRARFTGGDTEAAMDAVSASASAWHRRGRWIKNIWNRLRGRGPG